MEEKKTVFEYMSDVFSTFGIIVVIFMALNLVIGEIAFGYSPFFEYGKQALSIKTLLQLFAVSVIIRACREVLLTDRWIRQMSMLVRNILFFVSITITVIFFVIVFQWFPLLDVVAWLGFLISFALCSAVAVVISRMREKAENLKMEQALERYNKR